MNSRSRQPIHLPVPARLSLLIITLLKWTASGKGLTLVHHCFMLSYSWSWTLTVPFKVLSVAISKDSSFPLFNINRWSLNWCSLNLEALSGFQSNWTILSAIKAYVCHWYPNFAHSNVTGVDPADAAGLYQMLFDVVYLTTPRQAQAFYHLSGYA